jgi:hypothetical protein
MKRIEWFSAAPWLAVLIVLTAWSVNAPADTDELERYIRARIEIGETMTKFMGQQGGGMDRSPENMRKMETEITAKVAAILEKYGLTIEEYRKRSPVVFADEAKVAAFLESNPDLKKRYEALPLHNAPERRGRHKE